jgi:hypothetical protein
VAGGNSGQLHTSTDGTTWTTRNSTFSSSTQINSVSYGNSLWVIAGNSGQLRTSAISTAVNSISLTLSTDISGSDVRLRGTFSDAATVNGTVKVVKTLVEE